MDPLGSNDPTRIGPYEIVGRLGAGGMGTVYLGRTATGELAAVKVVHVQLAMDPEFRARFQREVAAMRLVGGSFTARFREADPNAPQPWLATDHIPGPTLAETIEAHGPLPEASVRSLALGLTDALAGIHATGLVHRDLKPSNVILTTGGPRVIDFGVAKAAHGDIRLTRTGLSVGTHGYVAPEVLEGKPAGPSADVFALGILLAFAATARHPFDDDGSLAGVVRILTTEPQLDGVPLGLRAVVEGCLHKEPERRWRVVDLRSGLDGATTRAPDGIGWLPEPVRTSILRTPTPGAPPPPGPTPLLPTPAGAVPAGPSTPGHTPSSPGTPPFATITQASGHAPLVPSPRAGERAPVPPGPPHWHHQAGQVPPPPAGPPVPPVSAPPRRPSNRLPVIIVALVVVLATSIGVTAGVVIGRDVGRPPGSDSTTAPPTTGGPPPSGRSPDAGSDSGPVLTEAQQSLYDSVGKRGLVAATCRGVPSDVAGVVAALSCTTNDPVLEQPIQLMRFVDSTTMSDHLRVVGVGVTNQNPSGSSEPDCRAGDERAVEIADASETAIGFIVCRYVTHDADGSRDFRISWGLYRNAVAAVVQDSDPYRVGSWWTKYATFP